MQKAVNFIESNLLDDINQDDIAKSVYSSSYHFQRIFSMIAGVTVGEYIRTAGFPWQAGSFSRQRQR
jgi:AraC family transcriptional regulator